MSSTPRLLWRPSEQFKVSSNLHNYINWLEENKGISAHSYHELWQWSVDKSEDFWKTIWDYFEIISHSPYRKVLSGSMPDAKWFEGASVNYAEHIFRNNLSDQPAIQFKREGRKMIEISWSEMKMKVASVAKALKDMGVEKGDRVVAYLPNIPEATIAFLATNSIGAIWSSCSPDFGSASVVDRFRPIEPKVLIAVDGYSYNGKPFDKSAVVREIVNQLPSLKHVIEVPYLNPEKNLIIDGSHSWLEMVEDKAAKLEFTPVDFHDPIWILFTSGTTGQPKAITHSVGGVLLEHFKYLAFHNDVKQGEKFFWYSTTGWMMWNYVQASLLHGATIILYDGSPTYPNMNALWELTAETEMQHFGTSAPYIIACMKQGIVPSDNNLHSLRSISSTGAPLPPDAFDWIYENVKSDVWLCSMSGGTDVCSAFVGGCPTEPVYEGEIQCRALGCALDSYDESGKSLNNEIGEMVITQPMPSMPIYFWNDPGKVKYKASYFEDYPGIWRHGDWVKITERNSLVIMGRSDATLNRHGIRIGTAEIYEVIDKIEEINDSLIVNIEQTDGGHKMPLFVVLKEGQLLDEKLKQKINQGLKEAYSPRHVPDMIVVAPDIPYTISGKRMEAPVKKILMGRAIEKSVNMGAIRNPESIDFFIQFQKQLSI